MKNNFSHSWATYDSHQVEVELHDSQQVFRAINIREKLLLLL